MSHPRPHIPGRRPMPGHVRIGSASWTLVVMAIVANTCLGLPPTTTITNASNPIDEGSDTGTLADTGVTYACGERRCPQLPDVPDLPSEGILIEPGTDIQQVVDANPPGTIFILAPGVHRGQNIVPKDGNAFIGRNGSILSGAMLITQMVQEGAYRVIAGQTAEGERHGECRDGYSGCIFPEQLFIGGQPLWQVTNLSEVKPGTWFFDYQADKVYFTADPGAGEVELGVVRHAFSGSADDVTVANLVIEKYANPAQTGVVHPRTGSNGPFGSDWMILGNEVRFNHGEGVKLGPGMLVQGNNLHHNGRLGLHASSGQVDGGFVVDNEISYNCTLGFACLGWGGGGIKVTSVKNVVLEGNQVHHNLGPGLHSDVGAVDLVVKDNVITENHGSAVVIEITYGAVVTGNTISRNGFEEGIGAGVLVISSSDVRVTGNQILDNNNGVLALQIDRGTGPHGAYELEDLLVENNLITMTVGFTGLREEVGDPSYFTDRNNRFRANTYELGSNSDYYRWGGATLTTDEWIGAGQDVNGEWRE